MGEWPTLNKIVKTRLKATLQRCNKDERLKQICDSLLPLVTDPWGHPTLKAILAGSPVSDKEVEEYILEETWPIFRVRINTLVEQRCEKIAFNVLKECMRYIRLKANTAERPLLNSQEDHNHFVDLYFILLCKYEKQKFVQEIKDMNFVEGANHVRRLLAQQEQQKGKIWKSRRKVANLEMQIFVTACIMKPFDDVFPNFFIEWCNVMKELEIDGNELVQMMRKFLELKASSRHVYTMGSILHQQFGEIHAALVTELLIRALTSDMNELEAVKLQAKDGPKEEQIRLEHQMADGFMNLATVFALHESVARECVLTAFSLHPTQNRLEELKNFGLSRKPATESENIENCEKNSEISSQNKENSEMISEPFSLENSNALGAQCLIKRENPERTELSNNVIENLPCQSFSNSGTTFHNQDQVISHSVSEKSSATLIQDTTTQTNNNCISDDNVYKVSLTETAEIEIKDYCETQVQNSINLTSGVNQTDSSVFLDEGRLSSDSNSHQETNSNLKANIDVWEFMNEHGKKEDPPTVKLEDTKVKEDIDSMDGFLATTEGLIEQLNQGKSETKLNTETEQAKESDEPPPQYDILTDSQAVLNKEKLGISKELCDDLAVVLSSPRWQVLSWKLEKSQLLNICEKYMNNVDSAKNVTKELKFLNIDYNQFKHLPSAEVDEFTGIEKGYEHFMEQDSDIDDQDYYYGMNQNYSSGSDFDGGKRSRGSMFSKRGRRGRPPSKQRYFNSDSDSTGRSRSRARTTTSFSESEDSEFELNSITGKDKEFEGKRVTAISSFDKRKRLRIDATTGRVKRSYVNRASNTSLLRLYRHKNSFSNSNSSESFLNHSVKKEVLNNNSSVVLNHYDRSSITNKIQFQGENKISANNYVSCVKNEGNNTNPNSSKSEGERKPTTYFQRGNWRYAGYVISRPHKDNSSSVLPTTSTQPDTIKCSYRTREGRLVTMNSHNGFEEKKNEVDYRKRNSTKYQDTFAKFLMQQKQPHDKLVPNITITKNTIPIEESLQYLKRQGTSVIRKKNDNATVLATAQKNVLNQIMSPENSRHDFVGRSDHHLPVRAIAMPVSHNPPNLPPDKSNPTGLSRALPKGTTVVRRSKIDSGAGPSGLNNGGSTSILTRSPLVRTVGNQPRPTISITPSSNFLGSGTPLTFPNPVPIRSNLSQQHNAHEGPSTSYTGPSQTENERFSPLASATVVGSVSQTLSPRLNSNNSPSETQGSCFVSLNSNLATYSSNLNQAASNTTTTTVATISGETRTPSMLETLLRDRSTPSSPLVQSLTATESSLHTTTSSSVNEAAVTSITGSSVPGSSLTEAVSLVTTPSICSEASLSLSSANITSNTLSDSHTSGMTNSINLGVSTIPVVGSSVLSSSLPVISSGVGTHVAVSTGGTSPSVEPQPSGMHQLLLPAHFIQVQGSDGSTNLGIVHPGSFDLRFPPGTRVIKSASTMRPTTPLAISQSGTRPLNVLHNVKIVQNRQIVRTVVVPHSVALQGLSPQQTAQLVTLGQSPGASNTLESQSGAKISSTQLQKMLGHNVVPSGLVIRTIRPSSSEALNDDLPKPSSIIQHTSEIHQSSEKGKELEKNKGSSLQTQEEGLAERLNRNFLKNTFLASTSTQSVGTQTQTTAVKPVTGQLVNQVVMNHLRGIGGISSSSVPVSATPVVTNAVTTPALGSLSLSSSNAVSSETLEQLREFESVFEKVSNKSVKENDTNTANNQNVNHPPNASSEESMIAAQLLSMSNDTPNPSGSSFVYTIPTTSTESSVVALSSPSTTANVSTTAVAGARLGEGTFITIPTSTQGGTLILVNPSAATSGTMTITNNAQATQPPPAASPALSSTSSHSSVASSPSSTSSKSKSKSSKSKGVTSSSTPLTPTKPKSPPPPKAPPKPAVAKPQVEESEETKARIQAILDQYRQDLANTPQPQPAPRNRKNCPPPKNEGKSSSKKKSQVKKPDGTTSTSPNTSESGHLPSVSPSPAPLPVTPSGEDSDGSIGGVSVASSHFHSQEEKKPEESQSPQILQGVVVSNMKVDNSGLGSNLSLPQGRVVQLIRHGSKVTAITTRQPYQKSKTGLASGGPPPNVTIQGRINMNELMESHLASLLTQGSATISPGSAIITKLIQAQQQHTPSVQQLVVQTSGGIGQQIQQVSLQPVIATTSKSQIQNHLISGGVNVADSSNPTSNSAMKPILQPQPSPALSVGVSHSPGTPQQRVSSPSTPSPAPELPSTPSSFPTADESNSSEESAEGTSAAPLPPFFTLTKQYMSPQQNQQLNSSGSQVSLSSDSARSPMKIGSETPSNNSPGRNLNSQSSRSSPFIRSSYTKSMSLSSASQSSVVSKSNISGTVMLAHSAPPSPLANQRENVLDMSPVSGPSSLENSPLLSQRLPLVTTSELKSNSLDSVKSDLSVEEVQIPPSPATLTKQLQNAYMTESALSPTVSHSHLSSSSSYSSPTTIQDLQTGPESRVIFPNLGHTSHTYSLAGQSSSTSSLSNNSNCSSSHNNPSMENNALACLSSPSGDVYLDQAGVGLGLDSLPLVEGRSQSPSLSDLVPAVPLLSWSPRSADSIMGQSPSLNEALTGNITLDVHHSEDSLCDSSTGFPGLFAMDGDAASASSSSTDDVLNSSNNSCPISTFATTTTVFSVAPSQSHSQANNPVISSHTLGKRISNHEQDHTVSSTKTESSGSSLIRSSLQISQSDPNPECDQSPDRLKEDSTVNDDTWKHKSGSSNIKVASDDDDDEYDDISNDNSFRISKSGSSAHSTKTFNNQNFRNVYETHKENCKSKELSDFGVKKKIRNQAQHKEIVEKDSSTSAPKDEVVHNGYEKLNNCKNATDNGVKIEDFVYESKSEAVDDILHSHRLTHKCNSLKPENAYEGESFAEGEKHAIDVKKETKLEVSGRQTRGSKRRNDSDFVAEEKRSRSSRSRRPEPLPDLSPEEEKPPTLLSDDGALVGPLTRSLRGRNVSGTSDSSSNYSIDRVSTPGPQDSPAEAGNIAGVSRRRKRRGSHDSSVSSRDGSPLTVLLNSQQDVTVTAGGMHTRRSSSRDHAKKTRCRCCVDQSSPTATVGGSNRRTSGRVSRGSGTNASSSAS
ncbi:Toll-interacting protein [Armadillidium nasatum]|uniref:Toll-interacting protein n=1 Tax=Armadillidium nasatum TaxID=96803 RepID=A0A5N5SRI5_9CRUS|nr:Toll-interacting protein [Armadillidium nasatum]